MSTSDPQGGPPLTRRQMRELRATSPTGVVSDDEVAAAQAAQAQHAQQAQVPPAVSPQSAPQQYTDAAPQHLNPTQSPAYPGSSEQTYPAYSQQNAAHAASPQATGYATPQPATGYAAPSAQAAQSAPAIDPRVEPLTRRQARHSDPAPTQAAQAPEYGNSSIPAAPDAAQQAGAWQPAAQPQAAAQPNATWAQTPVEAEVAVEELTIDRAPAAAPPAAGATVRSDFGASIQDSSQRGPGSFDQLLERSSSSSGTSTAANALIISDAPSLSAPVASTGELLATGSFALPEGIGSMGHARGTTDGKEADASLIDKELPAASSPTPVAASAAISTVKSSEQVMRQPQPERGSRLMLILAITAGALALALIAVLGVAYMNGVFG